MRLLTEFRYAVRSLRQAGGFTTMVVITLGLGLGLCVTVLVVLNAYLVRGLPYPEADRLYSIRYGAPGTESPRDMETLDWRSLDDVVEHPIAWDLDMFYLLGGDHAEAVPGAWVTPGFVEGLGIQPALGRRLDAGSFASGASNVALISHRLWQARYAGDPAVLGRTFTAYVSDRPDEAESFTIVGVLPDDFWHINPYTDILTPLRAATYPYMVRLKPGVTAEYAAKRVTGLVAAGARSVPDNWRALLLSTHDAYVMGLRPLLQALGVAVLLVLLVSCGNVAGLLLIRAIRRQREVALRSALGAGWGTIARMLLAEAVVIGAAAAILAIGFTAFALDALGPIVQQQLGRPAPGGAVAFIMETRTLAAAGVIGIAAAVLCTLAPLVTTLRPRSLPRMHSGSRATEGRGSQRMRAGLVALEVAASLALLTGSALMLRSVGKLVETDLGIDSERVLTASVTLRANRYPDAPSRTAVFDAITSRLAALPGAESVALTTAWPVQQPNPDRVRNGSELGADAGVHAISDCYFDTLGIPLVVGRPFTTSDRAGGEPVAIVSQTLAARLWPEGGALGDRIIVPAERHEGEPIPLARRVVGIAADARQTPDDDNLADVYVPLLQRPGRFAFVLVRSAGDPAGLIGPFRSAFRDIDPEIAVHRPRALQALVDGLTARPRFLATLLGTFAAIAALLSLVGMYGVIAYAVRQREREIAVRLAIGADPARVTRFFVREGGRILLAGLALGLPGALTAGSLIERLLFGVTAHDPAALSLALLIFAAAGLFAIWWPSRRAAMTDPAIALRVE